MGCLQADLAGAVATCGETEHHLLPKKTGEPFNSHWPIALVFKSVLVHPSCQWIAAYIIQVILYAIEVF